MRIDTEKSITSFRKETQDICIEAMMIQETVNERKQEEAFRRGLNAAIKMALMRNVKLSDLYIDDDDTIKVESGSNTEVETGSGSVVDVITPLDVVEDVIEESYNNLP